MIILSAAISVQAKDGVCDEGRVSPRITSQSENPLAVEVSKGQSPRQLLVITNLQFTTRTAGQQVLCDLGTDCGDCGPWGGHLPRW